MPGIRRAASRRRARLLAAQGAPAADLVPFAEDGAGGLIALDATGAVLHPPARVASSAARVWPTRTRLAASFAEFPRSMPATALEAAERELWMSPTIMDVDRELALARCLMAVPTEQIDAHRARFFDVLADLELSHGDAFWSAAPEALAAFEAFAAWLEGLAARLAGGEAFAEGLRGSAETFRLDPRQVR
jgi:hypothetical protein